MSFTPRFFLALRSSALAAPLALAACSASKAPAPGPRPAVPVTIAAAVLESVPIEVRAIGNVEPSAIIQIKSQIAGELLKVHFTEGQVVSQGQLLFEIDPRPYQQALLQAEAALARDRAMLQQSQANLARDQVQAKTSTTDAARYDQLLKEGIVSQTQQEQARSSASVLDESVRADRAAIDSARAALNSDQAAIDKAKLDIEYCSIHSPIAGRAGNLLVDAGNLVKDNADNPLVIIHQVAPIFVSFGVPEQYLNEVRRNGALGKLPVDIEPQDTPGKHVRGTLSVIDNTIDKTTGTIRLKAVFPNLDGLLWPGQLVNVTLTLGERLNATVVPSEAVQSGQKGQFLYVVKNDQTVEPRNVKVGMTVDRKVVIDQGVAAGENVVTDGQLLLYPGARIESVAAVKPIPGA